jgi:hypothetical protein
MSPVTVEHMVNIAIFDMSALRFRPNASRTALAVLAPSGEHLAVIGILPDTPDDDAVFAVLDHALASARVRRSGTAIPVALYHPLTCELAVGANPTRIYTANKPVGLSPHGELGQIDADGIRTDQTLFAPVEPTFVTATRAWEASRTT